MKNESYIQAVLEWEKDIAKWILQEDISDQKLLDLHRVLRLEGERLLTNRSSNLHHFEELANQLSSQIQLSFERTNGNVTPIGEHVLPPLPYSYNALEPYIAEEIMRLHHTKHHQSYVTGLNKAEKALQQARETGDFTSVKAESRELAFHGSGHYLHTIFWTNLSPEGGGEPTGRLRKQIEKDFGSYQAFKSHFSEAAKAVEGVGWAILVWAAQPKRLEILQSERHMLLTQWNTIPILALDVWEHAYYLQYENRRPEYVEAFWNVVNWKNVADRLERAKAYIPPTQ
ncbi:superoxide dismutase [Mangrovibacillus cuniculi]|uniref:superoxide dismutase n=1 Tax=Mangrovibacillus cuniculi TaxID=2593652 RepID=A0A7S8CB65_9BACI|nr:superoxide dismutase [Mangrovibacillus cuniculi]QPC46743.1 superoxide dismutase [Mangrovibacillus cuniculi]